MEIVWSDLALRDLNDIALYVSDRFGDSISKKSISKIIKKVEELSKFPESGILDKSYSTPSFSVHHVTLVPNVIYYLLEDDAIVVMTILHVKRSPRYVNKALKSFIEHFISNE